jgi:hypothetical protein
VILGIVDMWPPHLPRPSPDVTKEIKQRKLAAAKKMLREFQQRNGLGVPLGPTRKQRKKGRDHDTAASGGGNPAEDAPQDRAPAPTPSGDTGLPASVPSPDATISSEASNEKAGGLDFVHEAQALPHIRRPAEPEKAEEGPQEEAQELEELRRQLQLHRHTIETLQTEKSSLQAALAHMEQDAR